jgi:hypothetical protein
MSTNRRRNAAGLIVVALALAVSLTAWAKKPEKPGGGGGGSGPVDTGTIYYWSAGSVYSMQPDGSGKTQLLASASPPEPSDVAHSGDRWFLTAKAIAGEVYPDGNPRFEVFAVSEGGTEVQITDDPTVQPTIFEPTDPRPANLRWASRDGVVDGKVSYNARRWGTDGTGADVLVENGIFVAAIDPDSLGGGLVPVAPVVLPVEVPLLNEPSGGYSGPFAVQAYDWSPDGTRITYSGSSGLHLADADSSGPGSSIGQGGGWGPRWSPVGDLIAFTRYEPEEGYVIDTISANGSGQTTVVPAPKSGIRPMINSASVRWSPNATNLIYSVSYFKRANPDTWTDIWRVAADGGDGTNLTRDIDGHQIPLGWKAD